MSASTSITASMAWVLPVRPDKLGPNLQAYEDAVPMLHALRLCNRFGRGEDVHIIKLPSELVLLIEELIIESRECVSGPFDKHTWSRNFECFESRCAPSDHVWEENEDLLFAMIDFEDEEYCGQCRGDDSDPGDCDLCCNNAKTDLCKACKTENSYEDCEKSCRGRATEFKENFVKTELGWKDIHYEASVRWKGQVSGKNVDKMNATLRQHFGLEVTFSNNSIDYP